MKVKHLIPILGGAGVLAYAWGRSHRATVNTGPIVSTPVGSTVPPTGVVSVPPSNLANGAYGTGWPAASQDVSDGIDNSERHVLFSDLSDGQDGAALTDTFFRHVWLPASKFKLSNMTPYQTRCAFGVLSGGNHRNQNLEARYKQFIFDEQQRATQAIAGSVFAAVGSIIPIVGKVFATVVQSAVSAASTDIIHDASASSGMLSSLHTAVDLKNLDPPAQMLLQPGYNNKGESLFDMNAAPWVQEAGIQVYAPVVNGQVPVAYMDAMGKQFRIGKEPVRTFAMHARYWNSYQYGLMLPWVCDEFFGPGSTTKDQVNSVAAIYKFLDILSCIAFPDSSIMDPARRGRAIYAQQFMNYYYYNNKYLGPILGSIFPPTDEDTFITDTNGELLDYNGQPFPILKYTFIAGPMAGTTNATTEPHSVAEWNDDQIKLAIWKQQADDWTRQSIIAGSAPDHTNYWDQYYDGQNLDTGEYWTMLPFTLNDFVAMTPDVYTHLIPAQLSGMGFTGRVSDKLLVGLDPAKQAFVVSTLAKNVHRAL